VRAHKYNVCMNCQSGSATPGPRKAYLDWADAAVSRRLRYAVFPIEIRRTAAAARPGQANGLTGVVLVEHPNPRFPAVLLPSPITSHAINGKKPGGGKRALEPRPSAAAASAPRSRSSRHPDIDQDSCGSNRRQPRAQSAVIDARDTWWSAADSNRPACGRRRHVVESIKSAADAGR